MAATPTMKVGIMARLLADGQMAIRKEELKSGKARAIAAFVLLATVCSARTPSAAVCKRRQRLTRETACRQNMRFVSSSSTGQRLERAERGKMVADEKQRVENR